MLERLLQRSAMAALLPEEAHEVALDQPSMAPLFGLLRLHLRETLGYTPTGSIAGGAVLFRSSWVDDRPRWMKVDPDPTYGWSKLCRGGVEIASIPGDHLAVIRQPHVRELAARLEAALRAGDAMAAAAPDESRESAR
ncbi:MAG: hypothetical protein RIT45_3984 [Pseudomonadota bacterium]